MSRIRNTVFFGAAVLCCAVDATIQDEAPVPVADELAAGTRVPSESVLPTTDVTTSDLSIKYPNISPELAQEFKDAVEFVLALPRVPALPMEIRLFFYANFKLGEGEKNLPTPAMDLNYFANAMKFNAWYCWKEHTQEEGIRFYIQLLDKLAPKWREGFFEFPPDVVPSDYLPEDWPSAMKRMELSARAFVS